MPTLRCRIQDKDFDVSLLDVANYNAVDHAIVAMKFIQISTILTEHAIGFEGLDNVATEQPAFVVNVPDHMGCFEVLDVMREIKNITGLWIELNDPIIMAGRGFSKAQQRQIAAERFVTAP